MLGYWLPVKYSLLTTIKKQCDIFVSLHYYFEILNGGALEWKFLPTTPCIYLFPTFCHIPLLFSIHHPNTSPARAHSNIDSPAFTIDVCGAQHPCPHTPVHWILIRKQIVKIWIVVGVCFEMIDKNLTVTAHGDWAVIFCTKYSQVSGSAT